MQYTWYIPSTADAPPKFKMSTTDLLEFNDCCYEVLLDRSPSYTEPFTDRQILTKEVKAKNVVKWYSKCDAIKDASEEELIAAERLVPYSGNVPIQDVLNEWKLYKADKKIFKQCVATKSGVM